MDEVVSRWKGATSERGCAIAGCFAMRVRVLVFGVGCQKSIGDSEKPRRYTDLGQLDEVTRP